MADKAGGLDAGNQSIQRKTSISTSSDEKKVNKPHVDVEVNRVDEGETASHNKSRVFVLIGLAALILGWWISSTVLEATRGRWYGILHSEEFLCFISPKDRADNLRLVSLNVSNYTITALSPLPMIRNIKALSHFALYPIRW